MLITVLIAFAGPCPGGGCAPNFAARDHPRLAAAFSPFTPNVAVFFGPDPLSLIDRPYNHAWTTPLGGFTLYPGQAGSGYTTHSDYSHINWLSSPEQNAGMVRGRLAQLGIPAVPPEPLFLGKNPAITDDIKLPPPRAKPKDPPPEDKETDK